MTCSHSSSSQSGALSGNVAQRDSNLPTSPSMRSSFSKVRLKSKKKSSSEIFGSIGHLHRLFGNPDGRRGHGGSQQSSGAPVASSKSLSPLAGAGPDRCISPVQSRTRKRLGVILFWTGEVIAGLCIVIGPFILLFLGKVYQ